jgi:hypothetical protein
MFFSECVPAKILYVFLDPSWELYVSHIAASFILVSQQYFFNCVYKQFPFRTSEYPLGFKSIATI